MSYPVFVLYSSQYRLKMILHSVFPDKTLKGYNCAVITSDRLHCRNVYNVLYGILLFTPGVLRESLKRVFTIVVGGRGLLQNNIKAKLQHLVENLSLISHYISSFEILSVTVTFMVSVVIMSHIIKRSFHFKMCLFECLYC